VERSRDNRRLVDPCYCSACVSRVARDQSRVGQVTQVSHDASLHARALAGSAKGGPAIFARLDGLMPTRGGPASPFVAGGDTSFTQALSRQRPQWAFPSGQSPAHAVADRFLLTIESGAHEFYLEPSVRFLDRWLYAAASRRVRAGNAGRMLRSTQLRLRCRLLLRNPYAVTLSQKVASTTGSSTCGTPKPVK
jgi:hypothetical protein